MLTSGSRFGAYEIVAPLGAGGMGEVYRARDSALARDVALKILPEAFAQDADRLARFRREAQVLASLNHPNIASIYGLADSREGGPALVLELVDGPTLAEALSAGPLPRAKALGLAGQLADGLDYAHQQNVVHRDLKPANIKLRADGTVKVLDFGLAKALDRTTLAEEASQSPTRATPEMTQFGVVLGTPAYMSPEQALGDRVDQATDIWAFGCVLFEMVTGVAVFAGESASAVRTAIVRDEPEWSRLPADTPEALRRVLRRCLEKDSKRRLADIRDARLDLQEAASPPMPEPASPGPRRRERLLWAAVGLLALSTVGALVWGAARARPGQVPVEMRVEITTPPTTDMVSLALSPDGRTLAFVASGEGRPRLWLRSLETGSSRPLDGTEGATFPFWSPDGRSVGFFAGEKLGRLDIDTDSSRVIGPAIVAAGGAWGRGQILYPMVPDSPLMTIPDSGGSPTQLGGEPLPAAEQTGQRFPQFLPDGRHFLYFVAETRGVYLGSLDGRERRRVFDADSAATLLLPAHILFVRQGSLFRQGFDTDRAALTGDPVRIADRVVVDPLGAAAVSASAVGSFVFRTGAVNQQRQLVWVDRSGAAQAPAGEPDDSFTVNPALSPDGSRVALTRSTGGNSDIWILDVARNVLNRFTFDPTPEICPVWSPDGRELLFSKPMQRGLFALYRKAVAGGQDTPIVETGKGVAGIAMDWSRDGRFVMFRTNSPATGWDIWALPLNGDQTPRAIARSPFDERTAQLSPDVRWLAYESNESSRYEIYVQPFPGPGASTRVSTAGGSQVRWRADGRELFYLAPDGRLMAVSVGPGTAGRALDLGAPVALFVTNVESAIRGGIAHEYAVSSDGQRFLMNTYTEHAGAPLTLVLNVPRR